jgi:hypothetical protein
VHNEQSTYQQWFVDFTISRRWLHGRASKEERAMPHSMLVRLPSIRVAQALPPMYTWPTPVKQVVMGVCIALCISAYVAIAIGLIGAMSFALGLM